MPGFFKKGYSTSPAGLKLQKSTGYVNAGLQALNMLNSAYGSTNKVGNTLTGIGGVIGSIPNPYTKIFGTVLESAGTVVNAFTDDVNEDYVDMIGGQISNLANTTSDASDFPTLQQSYRDLAGSNIELGDIDNWGHKGMLGWGLKREKARNTAATALETAKTAALGNLNQQGRSINQNNFANQYSRLLAFGGPITGAIDYANMMDYTALKRKQIDKGLQYAEGGGIYIKPSKRGTFTAAATKHGMGVQEFANKVLANKENYSPAMVKKANFARNASKWHSFGGDLMTNGATWDNGFTYIGNGGSHESNPNEGVQVGIDPQGIPNLVEEGEVIWDDYVFSKRLKVPQSFRDKYKLKNGGSISFADAAKKFAEENKERPNDPISKKGRDALLTALMDQQEDIRMKKQQREAKAQFNSLTPDEQLGIMQMAQQNAMPVGPEEKYNNMEENTMISPSAEEQAPIMAAYGGRLFEGGGPKPNKTRFFLRDTDANGNPIATLLEDIPEMYEGYNTTTGQTWDEVLASKGFTRVGKPQKSTEKGTEYTDYFLQRKTPTATPTPQEDTKITIPLNLQQTASRYAPILGSAVGVFTDALDITNTPDFSSAKAIERAAERVGTPSLISTTPIGNRLTYKPFDLNIYSNQLRSSAALTGRSIMNQSAGNIGATTAGLLALNKNTIDQMGDLFRKGEEFELERKAKVADYNRATDIFNAQQALTAARANQAERRQAAAAYAAGIAQAEALRQRAKQYSDANRSANLTNFLQGLGDIGNENEQRNWLKTLYASGYFGYSPTMERTLYSDSNVLSNFMKNNPNAKVDDVVAATGINKKKVNRYFKKKGLTI